MENSPCQVLPPRYHREAATIMAHAFAETTAYSYIFQDHTPESRIRALKWIFLANITATTHRCPTALRGMLNDGGEVVAALLWTPSPHHDVNISNLMMAGMHQGRKNRFGRASMKRWLEISRASKDLEPLFGVGACGGKDAHFVHVGRVAVREDCRGKGLGSKCLKTVIAEEVNPADHTKQRRILRLVTRTESNVRFYKRLGFSVVAECPCPHSSEQYKYVDYLMTLRPDDQVN